MKCSNSQAINYNHNYNLSEANSKAVAQEVWFPNQGTVTYSNLNSFTINIDESLENHNKFLSGNEHGHAYMQFKVPS